MCTVNKLIDIVNCIRKNCFSPRGCLALIFVFLSLEFPHWLVNSGKSEEMRGGKETKSGGSSHCSYLCCSVTSVCLNTFTSAWRRKKSVPNVNWADSRPHDGEPGWPFRSYIKSRCSFSHDSIYTVFLMLWESERSLLSGGQQQNGFLQPSTSKQMKPYTGSY